MTRVDPGRWRAAVAVAIDGGHTFLVDLTAVDERPDLVAAFPRYGSDHGYHASFPVATDTRAVCVVAVGTGSGLGLATIGCASVK